MRITVKPKTRAIALTAFVVALIFCIGVIKSLSVKKMEPLPPNNLPLNDEDNNLPRPSADLTSNTIKVKSNNDILETRQQQQELLYKLLKEKQALEEYKFGVQDQDINNQIVDNEILNRIEPQIRAANEVFIIENTEFNKTNSSYHNSLPISHLSGMSVLPSGHLALFHRADREWNVDTFQDNFTVKEGGSEAQVNLIQTNTIVIISGATGKTIGSLGSGLFHMPHGIASDSDGNLWVTDVGRHQVMRLPTGLIRMSSNGKTTGEYASKSFPDGNSQLWPDIVLGEPFIPGNDDQHFCQPSSVAVSRDLSLVFIADGYCNSRIVVYTGDGRFVQAFGQQYNMRVVHSLTILDDSNLLCVADRENMRILCFNAGLDRDISKLGELALTFDFPLGQVYALTALDFSHILVSSKALDSDKFSLSIWSLLDSKLQPIWMTPDLQFPHSLASSPSQQVAYIADLASSSNKKVYKFDIVRKKFER